MKGTSYNCVLCKNELNEHSSFPRFRAKVRKVDNVSENECSYSLHNFNFAK